MRGIKNTQSALVLFIEAANKHGIASQEGDYKTANKNYDRIIEVAEYLKNCAEIYRLNDLLDHQSVGVRLWASAYLLSINEEKAREVLLNIVNEERGIHSLTAETTIQEWDKGNLKL